jgi:hypothetical protein
MTERNHDGNLELEAALAACGSAEPRPGLESRILRRAFAEDTHRKLAPPLWAWALPVCACLLVGVIRWNQPLWVKAPTELPAVAKLDKAATVTALPGTAITETRRMAGEAKPKARRVESPRQGVFPATAPLSRDEHALLAFVNRALPNNLKSLTEESDASSAPLQIEDITISPLPNDDGHQE